MNYIWNSFYKNKWLFFATIVLLVVVAMMIWSFCVAGIISQWLWASALTVFIVIVIGICVSLTNIFSLRKKDNGITWCQIFILFFILVWIFGLVWIFQILSNNNSTIVFGVLGGLFTLVFQDRIKGVITFIHLRANHLLSIGDWIQVPEYGVDGAVSKVTLTTVIVYNWDTTTSTIPISVLHNNHFINLQNMSEGKTFGRRMFKSFIIDTESFHPVSHDEVSALISKEFNENHRILSYLPEDEIKEGALNARLYRLYLYHWMMKYQRVSQKPRLMVRWSDQVEGGLHLLIYAFIVTDNSDDYEWQVSLLTEHILESLKWFGLRLYQRPSSYDLHNKFESV